MISRLIFRNTPRPTWPERLAANVLAIPLAAWLAMLGAGAFGVSVAYWHVVLLTVGLSVVLDVGETAWLWYRRRRR